MIENAPTIRYPYRWRLAALLFVLLCGSGAAAAAGTDTHPSFLAPGKAFSYTTSAGSNGNVRLHWHVADGYYLYRSRLKIQGVEGAVGRVDKPSGQLIHDPHFGDEHVYRHDVTITVDPGHARRLKLTWQGCAKAGLCYPPQHATIDVPTSESTAAAPGDNRASATPTADAAAKTPAADGSDQAFATQLADGALGWTLAAFFGMGLLLAFTPCVLPMVPILSGVIVGAGARGLRGAALSLAFVLPMAMTYAVLGVAAALAGANLQAALQTPAVLGAFAAVFGVLALAMFGVFELQLPAPLRDRLHRASANRRGGHVAGAAAMGVISAVLVGPCMTAPLAGALLYIADSGRVATGGLALFALGLGMGAPLLVVGTLGARFMPRPGPWMNAVKTVFGFVLLATAIWMIARVLPGTVTLVLWGTLAIAAGLAVGFAARSGPGAKSGRIAAATAAILLMLWGGVLVIGAAGGARDPFQPLAFAGASTPRADGLNERFQTVSDPRALRAALADARENHQWAVVDFYADWCVSCQVIDRTVFGNTRVAHALNNAALIRPDVTDDNAATRRLMKHFNVVGPPTIIFIAPDGREQRSARVVGELGADAFLRHWRRAHQSAGDAS